MNRIVEKVNFPIPKQPKAKRVAAYARVSSGKDEMLHSLSAQISYYSELIQSHPGWLYCGVFSDEAYTGTKDNRTGFQSLISECRAGNIDLIITKSISRFARNTVTLLETVRELKLLGIDVFFEEQNIHTLSGNGEVIEPDQDFVAIGSGGNFAYAAANGLFNHTDMSAEEIVRESLKIASSICVYTNDNITVEKL